MGWLLIWDRYTPENVVKGFTVTFQPFPNKPWFLRVCCKKSFENTVRKGEIGHNEQFLLFPQRFSTPFEELSAMTIKFKIVVCKLFELEESKICRLGKELKVKPTTRSHYEIILSFTSTCV